MAEHLDRSVPQNHLSWFLRMINSKGNTSLEDFCAWVTLHLLECASSILGDWSSSIQMAKALCRTCLMEESRAKRFRWHFLNESADPTVKKVRNVIETAGSERIIIVFVVGSRYRLWSFPKISGCIDPLLTNILPGLFADRKFKIHFITDASPAYLTIPGSASYHPIPARREIRAFAPW